MLRRLIQHIHGELRVSSMCALLFQNLPSSFGGHSFGACDLTRRPVEIHGRLFCQFIVCTHDCKLVDSCKEKKCNSNIPVRGGNGDFCSLKNKLHRTESFS